MCFRLLVALSPSPTESLVARRAQDCGLDVRAAKENLGQTGFWELAWGDCACSLYTRREGRQRVVEWVRRLLQEGLHIQLLLLSDDQAALEGSGQPVGLPVETFYSEGLQALPVGQVTALTAG